MERELAEQLAEAGQLALQQRTDDFWGRIARRDAGAAVQDNRLRWSRQRRFPRSALESDLPPTFLRGQMTLTVYDHRTWAWAHKAMLKSWS